MSNTVKPLVIISCGQGKVWSKDPGCGPTPAGDAYTGAPFKVNRKYAECFAESWVILSAKYGFIRPDFIIPEPYETTFLRKSTRPVTTDILRRQVKEMRLDCHPAVVGLGGKKYREAIEAAFADSGAELHFPFAGLPLGKMMQATNKAIEATAPP
mgnify:FL=1